MAAWMEKQINALSESVRMTAQCQGHTSLEHLPGRDMKEKEPLPS